MRPGAHRVLVVDDFPDAAQLVCRLLRRAGHLTCTADSGRAALAEAYSFDPSIVILDLDLPDVSGYDVARQLRARPGGRHLYIAALSGWSQPWKRQAALEAGCDDYVIKPASAVMIHRIIDTVEALQAEPAFRERDRVDP